MATLNAPPKHDGFGAGISATGYAEVARVCAAWISSRKQAGIAGKQIVRPYTLSAPQGVRGRKSDNTNLRHVLCREPAVSRGAGLTRTYEWIHSQLMQTGRLRETSVLAAA